MFTKLGLKALEAIKACKPVGAIESRDYLGGYVYKANFDNGYGISIVKHSGSYGHEDDQWEIAVLKDNKLCYDTPITSDVIGWLTDKEVADYAKQISELGKADEKTEKIKKLVTKIEVALDELKALIEC